MGKENPQEAFRKSLQAAEDSRALPPNPLWEASVRFDKTHEKSLIEAEQELLKKDVSIAPVVEIVNEAARAIEVKENFDWLNKQEYRRGGEYKLEKKVSFGVDLLGRHGDSCYPTWEAEGKFVQAVESGKKPKELIKSVLLEYRHVTIRMAVEVIKIDKENPTMSINWWVGESSGKLDIANSDYSALIELLTNKIAAGAYEDLRPAEGPF